MAVPYWCVSLQLSKTKKVRDYFKEGERFENQDYELHPHFTDGDLEVTQK